MRIHHDHPGHVPDFVRLVEAWLGASAWGLEDADHRLLRDPLRIVREGGSLLSLARGDEEVGVCTLFRDGADRVQLARMTVAEAERGQGHGERLLVAALDRARQMGASSVYLLTNTALGAAVQLGVSPHPVLMMVAVASSAAFSTPMSTPANMLVLGPGDYRFRDYVRVGVPLQIIVGIAALIIVPLFFPL